MEKVKNFFQELKTRFDFKFWGVVVFPLIIAVLTPSACAFLPEKYAFENSLIENFQLVVILASFIASVKAKHDKSFFYTLALVMIILFLREVNCGRTIFFPVDGVEDAFYSWGQIPYGYLAHPLYALFMVCSGLYFILSKGYEILFKYILHAKISVYAWVFVILGIILGTIGEKIGNLVMEEMTETLFYASLFVIIYLQGFNQKYIETTEKY